MELNEYQNRAMETCLPNAQNPLYMLMELAEECGELQGKFSKAIRHGDIRFDGNLLASHMSSDDFADWYVSVVKEIGDILWGVAGIARVMDLSLESVANENLKKLASRKQRSVIDGAGDNR